MASNKYLELQDYTDTELVNELALTKENFRKLKFDHTIKGLDNPLVLREARRDVARLNTEIRKRQMSEMSEEQLANRSKIRARRKKK